MAETTKPNDSMAMLLDEVDHIKRATTEFLESAGWEFIDACDVPLPLWVKRMNGGQTIISTTGIGALKWECEH